MLSWTAGHCVGYQEDSRSGNDEEGAYVCHLTIAASTLTWQAGGPGAYRPPTPGTHGQPPTALVNPFGLPLLPPTPVVVPVVEAATLTALAPVALILALILASTTPAGGPGIPHPPLGPVDPNLLRLNPILPVRACAKAAFCF